MTGKLVASVLSIFVFMYLILSGVSFYMYTGVNERVNDICYDVAETVSTKGLLSSEVYNYLCENLSRYGDFAVELKLECGVNAGQPDIFFSRRDILDRSLETGDRLTIAVYSVDPSMFEKLTGAILRPAALKVSIIA